MAALEAKVLLRRPARVQADSRDSDFITAYSLEVASGFREFREMVPAFYCELYLVLLLI